MTSAIPLFRLFFTGIFGIILVIQVKFQGQFQGQMRKYYFYEIQIAIS